MRTKGAKDNIRDLRCKYTKTLKEGSSMKTKASVAKALTILGFILIASMPMNERTMADKPDQFSNDEQSKSAISEIESKYVCMINDQSFNKEQIPVEIDGKTYYGCCRMCEAKLKSDPSSRMAVDPVSINEVDKATAVIGATPGGTVFYFESAENLKAFTNDSDSKE
jgi:YHS domain-containing protein